MPQVRFTAALKRFYPELQPTEVEGKTVAEIVKALNNRYPGLPDYIIEENGALRKHVHIFIGNDMIKDRQQLQDAVKPNDDVYIMQALSGG